MITKLSPKQRKIFDLMLEGLTCKEIGERLDMSPRTVEDHRRQARLKVGARNNTQMVAIILRSTQ